MKRQTLKEQQKINRALLRSVIQKKIDEGHPMEYADHYLQPCGTVGCALGDYLLLKEGKDAFDFTKGSEDPDIKYSNHINTFLKESFGIGVGEGVGDVLDMDFGGTWQDRLDTLDRLEGEIEDARV